MTTKDSEESVFVYVLVNSTIAYEGTREMKRSELVAAAEREACAKTVEDMEHGNVRTCAAAIRARSNT